MKIEVTTEDLKAYIAEMEIKVADAEKRAKDIDKEVNRLYKISSRLSNDDAASEYEKDEARAAWNEAFTKYRNENSLYTKLKDDLKVAQRELKAMESSRTKIRRWTCQICGGKYLAGNGKIAHHEFKRMGGWQTSSCGGAKHAPYEVSCDAILPEMGVIADFIERITLAMGRLIDNPPDVIEYSAFRGSWSDAKVSEEVRPDDFNPNKANINSPDKYSVAFSRKISEYKENIRLAEDKLVYLQEKLDSWVQLVSIDEVK